MVTIAHTKDGKMTWKNDPNAQPYFNITQDDCNTAAKGINMLAMSIPELKELATLHGHSHLFAGQVIHAAAMQMIQVKRFNCAGE